MQAAAQLLLFLAGCSNQSQKEAGAIWQQALHIGLSHAKESLKPIAGLSRITQPASFLSALPVSAQGDAGFRSQAEVRCIRRHVLHRKGSWRKKCLGADRRASPMSQVTVRHVIRGGIDFQLRIRNSLHAAIM